MLGLPKGKVQVVPHNPEWISQYEVEKALLIQILNNNIENVEHIGSTSIKGMQSKPIIDIMVGVNSMHVVENFDEELLKLNRYFRLKISINDKVVFAKFIDIKNAIKTHIIHVVQYNGEWWNKHLYFRDYLNNNKDAAKEYEKLKIELADKYHNDEVAYTREKENFVNTILSRST